MAFGILIHSVMPKAIISMPILMPIAQLSGVSGQVVALYLMTILASWSPSVGELRRFGGIHV